MIEQRVAEDGKPEIAFSVCIPNFNYGRYLGTTIQSVLNQTYSSYEIVVVDNASTDDSVSVVEAFQSDRIRLFRNPYNVGFAPNLDRAASQARHPFIILLSSDDVMHPTALEEYARVIAQLGDESRHALIGSAIEYIDGRGAVFYRRMRREFLSSDPDPSLTKQLDDPCVAVFQGLAAFRNVFPRNGVPTPFCSTAYSRELYDRVGGYSSLHQIGPDADFAYKALLSGAKVVFVDRCLFQYRVHNANNVSQASQQRSLKVPLDWYMFTQQFSNSDLARAGVDRRQSIEAFVDQGCLNTGLLLLKEGGNGQAFQRLALAMAAYPGAALRNVKLYLLAGLLMCGPLGTIVARWLWHLRERRRAEETA